MNWKNNFWLAVSAILAPVSIFADEVEAAAHAAGGISPYAAIAAGLGIALAVIAASTAQGRIGSAYLDGAARNPGAQKAMFVPMILGLAMVESLVLFTFIVTLFIMGKI